MLKQLSVFVENEVGSIAKVTSVLKSNGINLRAIASFDSPEFGILRIVVEDPEYGKKILKQNGFVVKVTEVVGVELEDRPGGLDDVLNLLASNGLCVNYIYSFVLRENKIPLMVMHIDDMEKGIEVLKENNIKLAE